jgi:hypothetical protein
MVDGFDAGRTGLADYETFISTLGDRDRRNVRKHVATCEAEPHREHAALWKRLFCSLSALGGRWVKTTGQRAVQFFAADGNYRMQLFALEDPHDGTLVVYAPDALRAAEEAGAIRGPVLTVGDAQFYEVGGVPGLMLQVEVLSAAKTVDAPEYYRHLLGWNRKALKITLRTTAGRAEVGACEILCSLAKRQAVIGLPVGVPDGRPDGRPDARPVGPPVASLPGDAVRA